jgi:hypothetical protein
MLALAALVAVACEPGYAVWFQNDSDNTVIVQFIAGDSRNKSGTGFAVAAHSLGGGYTGLGARPWSAAVRVLAEDGCRLLWQRLVSDARSGAIVVDQTGVVNLVTSEQPGERPSSDVPLRAFPETRACLPTGVQFVPVGT